MIPNVDPVALATLTFAVIGFVRLYNSILDKDWRTAGTIFIAGLAGAIFAPFAGGDLTWFVGMLIGFSASGVVTAVTRLGGQKDTPEKQP